MGRKARSFGPPTGGLNITSMMDMMTIILVFLLKSLDAEGNLLTMADNLQLANSSSKKTIQEVLLTVVVDNNNIVVDAQPVASTDEVAKQDSLFIGEMVKALEAKREEEKKHMMAAGEDPGTPGAVVVQLDKNLYYDTMYKVMASCGYAGYGNVKFAVLQRNAE